MGNECQKLPRKLLVCFWNFRHGPMAVIKSMISADGFVVSINLTNFGLVGSTVKVALIMYSNLLVDVVRLPPSTVAMLNGTGDSGYSIAFS